MKSKFKIQSLGFKAGVPGLFFSLIAILLITVSSCKQDFDITADYKEIPVVYGLLNQQENTHYIRIQKGYLIDGNALVAAGISDSVYYADSLTVLLKPFFNNSPSGSPFTLHKIDGNLIGLPKDTGTFANTPNILYTFTGNLDQNKTYKLEITNNSNGKKITAEVKLVKDFIISTPRKGNKYNLQNANPVNIRWNTAENAGIYDLVVRFYYTEYRLSDNSFYRDTFVDIPFAKSALIDFGANNGEIPLSSGAVLNYMAENVKSDIEVIREFNIKKGMEFKFAAGGTELANYIKFNQVQGGIASNEALSPYTNIAGGYGLLSSRYYKQVDSVLLTDIALDSIACSSVSRGLKFKNHSGQVCN